MNYAHSQNLFLSLDLIVFSLELLIFNPRNLLFSYDLFFRHELSTFFQIHVKNQSVNDHHLCKKLKCILPDIYSLIMEATYHTFKKCEVMMTRNHISLGQLDKNLADFCATIC